MKHLIEYSSSISHLFFHYLKGEMSKELLISNLKRIEARDKEDYPNKTLSFKFSKDDTLITSIDDLDRDLSDTKNKEFTRERMEQSIKLQGELLIYYV